MGNKKISVLILASRFDFSCDYVIAQLRKLDSSYLRINSEDLSTLNIDLDPTKVHLNIYLNDANFHLDINLKAVYYRRPVFLRDYNTLENNPVEQFRRHQWASFIRNLMVFDKSLWVNHPSATYYAEHKAIQLRKAHQIGFEIPKTVVGNNTLRINSLIPENKKIVIKGLDTVLLRQGNLETFGYTKVININDLKNEEINTAPITFQELLSPKIDLRVTVIGSKVFAVSILLDNKPIDGDWRQYKEKVVFKPFDLPRMIKQKCIELLKQFNLIYGAIDLAIANDKYYFIEINPTGEWAWLVNSAKLPIDTAIAKTLIGGNEK